MAEHVQQLGWSQESGETNLHDDWTCLAPSINEILKEDHLKAAIESLETDANEVPLEFSNNLENYFEPENQISSVQVVSDVVTENLVTDCESISTFRKDSNTNQYSDTDELNLSYNTYSCSQISLDAQKDAQIHATTAVLTTTEQNSRNIAFHPKDQGIKAHSLHMSHKENSPINSIGCNKPQHKDNSDTLSHNRSGVALNTDEVKDTEISHSPGRSQIIQNKMEDINVSAHAWTAEKNSIVTKPNTSEESTHSKTSVKYKPQFGNKIRKHPVSSEACENQCKVEKRQTDLAECKTSVPKSILAGKGTSVKNTLVETGITTNSNETSVAEDETVSHFCSESINVKTAASATTVRNNKDSSVATSTPTTSGNETSRIKNKTAKRNNVTAKCRDKPSKCASGKTGSESVLNKTKYRKTTSTLASRKGKNSATSDSKSAKQKTKANTEGQNFSTAPNSSQEKEQNSTGIKHFLEHQEKLASARNLLRLEKQKNESNYNETSVSKAGVVDTFEDTAENSYEEKLKVWDSEVSLLETLIEQVKSLTEGEEDPEKCFSLLGNIREKVSAQLLLKYPVLVAILEPIQRYDSDERIKQEAEDIYKKFNSMYIKQNMEDFVFAFDRTLKLHQQHLSKSERLAKNILKRILPTGETSTEVTFDVEMWNNLAKERSSVWERFVQEFRESEKTTTYQAASGSSSPTSNVKKEVQEITNHSASTDLSKRTKEQQETRKLPQPSHKKKTSHSSLMSNPRKPQAIVKPEHEVDNDTDIKPVALPASNKQSFRIKQETVMDVETLNTKTEIQRKQPIRMCKTPKIKEEVSGDETIIRIKHEFDLNTETMNTKKEMQQKQTQRSNKVKIKEVISSHEQTARIKEEIDSDMDIPNTNKEFPRIQPRRSCNPNTGKLEVRLHFAKRKRHFTSEKNEMFKKVKVSKG